ncbi:unnamed protein product [Closterium sp. NIES-64]|nr:unnamed protein product [Closterium sp. NIES-64]
MDCSSPRKCFAPAFSPLLVPGVDLFPAGTAGILLVVRPGDLLLPDEEEIGTFYRHLDPKTSSKRHEEKAGQCFEVGQRRRLVALLPNGVHSALSDGSFPSRSAGFFGECVKAELNR